MTGPALARLRGILPVTVRGRNRLRAGLLLAGAALAGYLVTCFAYPAPLVSHDREVGRLLGLPLENARKELELEGFRIKLEDPQTDPVIPAGHVAWQDPPPETAWPRGGQVEVTARAGPANVSVPDVASFELDQARQVVEAAGLRIGDVDTISSAAPEGGVIATRPPIAAPPRRAPARAQGRSGGERGPRRHPGARRRGIEAGSRPGAPRGRGAPRRDRHHPHRRPGLGRDRPGAAPRGRRAEPARGPHQSGGRQLRSEGTP